MTVVDSNFISSITAAEKKLTGSDEPVKGGPTAMAQKHTGQQLTAQVIHDITAGEKVITKQDGAATGGPTAVAQSILTGGSSNTASGSTNAAASGSGPSVQTTGHAQVDSTVISEIAQKEKELTGQEGQVQGGPTAKAQAHAGDPIDSQTLHDITEGEKKVTGGERVKGGPTSTAQSELAKSRQ
ncbi:MAG: hypothetical protein MMC23_002575 [Stictis urceolatum]|nr:hypothetical protein [Stictis urceolata]